MVVAQSIALERERGFGQAGADEKGPFRPLSGTSKRPFAFTLRGNPHESETAALSNGHSRSGIEEAEHLRRSHSLASVFFARSARPPSIDRYKKQEGARARGLGCENFPGSIPR